MTPTLAHCGWPLPPEGAAAPTVWQSQFRGTCLTKEAPTLAHCVWPLPLAGRYSPEASLLAPVQTCSSRFGAAGSSPEGAAAPTAWQSQFRGPCLTKTYVAASVGAML